MNTWKRWIASAWFALGVLTLLVTVSTDARAQAPAVDPAAVQTLKRMTDFLDGLQKFSMNTQSIVEEMRFSGHRVDYDLSAIATVRRPNKLRAVRTGELMNESLFYDGKTLTLYKPSEKVYATDKAPDTIEKMITFAREEVGILFPAADLLFSRPEVDFQVWVSEGKQPWPRKYVVTETATPSMLSMTTFLSNWNIAPAVDDALFKFVPPKGTQATTFLQLESTSGLKR